MIATIYLPRIPALWVFQAAGMSAMMLLALLGPGVIEEVMMGQMEGTQLSEGMLALIELWRKEYNHIRLHSALAYRPPAPAAVLLTTSLIQQLSLT